MILISILNIATTLEESGHCHLHVKQVAQLLQRDCTHTLCQLKSCQLLHSCTIFIGPLLLPKKAKSFLKYPIFYTFDI